MGPEVTAAIITAIGAIVAAVIAVILAKPPHVIIVTLKTQDGASVEIPMTPELKDLLARAQADSKREGKSETGTHNLYSAILSRNPPVLQKVLNDLSKIDALPNPISDELLHQEVELSAEMPLSPCISDSFNNLKKVASEEDPISTADVFFDIAKYGKGSSVQRLRDKGISENEVEQYTKQLKVPVKHRPLEIV